MKANVDCYTRGDPCEGQTCELNEVCLAISDDEGYCFPKECDFFDPYEEWDLKKKVKSQNKKVKVVDCVTKGDVCMSQSHCEVG